MIIRKINFIHDHINLAEVIQRSNMITGSLFRFAFVTVI